MRLMIWTTDDKSDVKVYRIALPLWKYARYETQLVECYAPDGLVHRVASVPRWATRAGQGWYTSGQHHLLMD